MGGGWFGVQLFFVLSGFIVALPFARHWLEGTAAPDLKRYLLRRLKRIEPPYMLALTAYYLVAGTPRAWLSDYLAGLTYTHQYFFADKNPIAPMTWSLEVEVVFYLLAPWLTGIYRIRGNYRRWLLQAVLIAAPALASCFFLGPVEPSPFQNTLAVTIQYFLAGMLLADFYACGFLRRSGLAAWDGVAAIAACLLTYIVCRIPLTWHYDWLTPALIMLVFAGVLRGRYTNLLFRLKPITITGGMCYTLYLSHKAVQDFVAPRLGPLVSGLPDPAAAVAYCAMVVPLMIAAGVPLYLLIEKPFMTGRLKPLRGPFPYKAAEGT